ncbi:hypothetical protein EV1_034363 [Malus domestica]
MELWSIEEDEDPVGSRGFNGGALICPCRALGLSQRCRRRSGFVVSIKLLKLLSEIKGAQFAKPVESVVFTPNGQRTILSLNDWRDSSSDRCISIAREGFRSHGLQLTVVN